MWNKAERFANPSITVKIGNCIESAYVNRLPNNSQEEFDILKIIIISKLQKKLSELEKQYYEL